MKLLIATTNPGKLEEILTALAGLPIELETIEPRHDLRPPEETGRTFEENARLKARYYSSATGLPSVAEDSGLEIDALAGAPGVRSARFGGEAATYGERFAMIERALGAAGAVSRAARFVCALALADGDRILFEARGTIEGRSPGVRAAQVGSATIPSSFTRRSAAR